MVSKADPTIKKSQRKTTALTKKIEKLTLQLQELQEKLKADTAPAAEPVAI
jgi:peptidoglycan hydrolase CwlO-like protein